MFDQLNHQMRTRSAALLLTIDRRLDRILEVWLVVAGLLSAARIALSPRLGGLPAFSTFAAYMLLVVAPFASTLLALHWFRDGHKQAQPKTRLARIGRWRNVGRSEAERHALYGAGGIMVSLLVGIMLNVPVRALEYLAAMPPVPNNPPAWLSSLHFAMTIDVVLFGSLYMIAFVAALRCVPLFPRLLLAIWVADLAMQLFTAELVTRAGNLPAGVAAALSGLLEGNVKKTLIGVAVWLPYLLLSKRVNVTYRRRVRG
jgi:hypothetical protein